METQTKKPTQAMSLMRPLTQMRSFAEPTIWLYPIQDGVHDSDLDSWSFSHGTEMAMATGLDSSCTG